MNSTENEAPPGFLRNLRKTFFTGLVLCLPLALTAYIVKFLLDLLASPAKDFLVLPVLKAFVKGDRATEVLESTPAHIAITLASALLAVCVILSCGYISRHLL